MFRRKKKSTPEMLPMQVSGNELLHRFLLDTQIGESQQLSLLLGLAPLDDPDEEAALSDERVYRSSPVIPLVRTFSRSFTAAIVEWHRMHNEAYTDLTDEEAAALMTILDSVATSTTIGTLTQLESLGLINYVWSDQ